MHQYRSAKIYFCFAVLFLVAKPFLGFTMFSRLHPPAEDNIFVKAFNKRKQEYAEDSAFDIGFIAKKLANPVEQLFLRFTYFLNILFPYLFNYSTGTTSRSLREIRINVSVSEHSYLRNGKLLI